MSRIDLSALPKALYLTEEEAMALLDICLVAESEFDPIKEQAVGQLTNLCRTFIRHSRSNEAHGSHAVACQAA